MAASTNKSIRLSNDLAEAAAIRAKALGYPDANSYHKSLLRYDLLVQGDHPITLPSAQLSPTDQDKLDAHLLMLTKRGKGERGQLLKHVLERMGSEGADLMKAMGL